MFQEKLLIGGKWVDAASGKTRLIYNPANWDEAIARVPVAVRMDAVQALEAARDAFPVWSGMSPRERSNIMHRAADLVRERVDEIARLMTLEIGKPLKDSRKEIMFAAMVLDYYADEGMRVYGEIVPAEIAGLRSLVIRQPVGVVSMITPWNFPVDLLAWKVAPALAAGCTFVAKPASAAPLSATEFVRAIDDAGLPPGTANVVIGPGSEVGAELVENDIPRKVAFTGETETGKRIMAQAAGTVKRVSLELGGNAPFVVASDADLDKAVPEAVRRSFSNMGQICISVNRIYVEEPVADEFIERFVERTRNIKVGNGMDPDVELGPMFDEEGRQKTKEHIADALEKGARLLYGGHEPEGPEYERGYFFLPTVLTDVDHSMLVMREETFGPVAPIMRVKSFEEAIDLANDTRYGLAAYVYTSSLAKAMYAAEKLEAGGVGINVNDVSELQAPFGGWKQSGFGRELGRYGMENYLEIKHVKIRGA